jgi:crotonobetaine/carnitine-CoA ligase
LAEPGLIPVVPRWTSDNVGNEHRFTRTIGGAFQSRLSENPNQAFVKCGLDWNTFADLDVASRRLAAGLAELGIEKGDRIALLLPTRSECIELFLGCSRSGVVLVLLNHFLKGEFLRYQLADSGAKLLVTDGTGIEAVKRYVSDLPIKHLVCVDQPSTQASDKAVISWQKLRSTTDEIVDVQIQPEDLALIVYTSGSTGLSKGCMLNQGYVTQMPTPYVAQGWVRPGDRIFTSFGFGHISGPMSVMCALMIDGGSVCFEPTFSASRFLDQAHKEQATVAFGVNTMAAAILAQPPKQNDGTFPLRLAIWIGMSSALHKKWEHRFKGTARGDAYGQSECAIIAIGDGDTRGGLGRPVSFLEVKLFNDADYEVDAGEAGEIVIRPRFPNVTYSGYWGKPEETLAAWRNLWHHTGDLAYSDEDGHLHFVDRKKDSIRRRGENVSSFELESAILRHDEIHEVAACAIPSPLGGDDIKVWIVPKPDHILNLADLFEFFKDNLPYFAIPKYVEFCDSLPRAAVTGRLQKDTLRSEGVTEATFDLEELGFRITQSERRTTGS